MFRVEIDGRVSFMVVHTDDVDGVCDDPRDGQAIQDKFHAEFGVTTCDPKHMLGVNREMSEADGVVISRHTQKAYIEEVWDQFKEYRAGRGAPDRPANDMKFTDEMGNLITTDESEYGPVKDRGYRKLIGCMLWPARNAYPMISYAISQLCRCMEKPSEQAWESAMHTLHYLFETRETGIGYRSDGDPIPRCYYDSGHMQDRANYRNQYGIILTWVGAHTWLVVRFEWSTGFEFLTVSALPPAAFRCELTSQRQSRDHVGLDRNLVWLQRAPSARARWKRVRLTF